tara:strand:+ start:29 stop:1150 length:1122 start_codon:yes stop_codon:yes gene_type:complete
MKTYFFLFINLLLLSCIANDKNDINYKIGVLLPLESKNAVINRLAKSMKDASILAKEDLGISNLKIEFFPTSGDPQKAYKQAKLAIDNNVDILVGPLYSDETKIIKPLLKKNNINLISFSNDISVAGNNVFIIGLTYHQIASRLVQYALSRDINKIGIVAPSDQSGKKAVKIINEVLREKGAALTVVTYYPLTITGIKNTSSAIYNELVTSNSQGIIFTDTPTLGLGFMAAEIDRKFKEFEKNNIQYMGLTKWDATKQTLNEPALQNGWFGVTDKRFKQKFEERFENRFGYIPHNFSSLSYDSIAALGAIIQNSDENFNEFLFSKKNITNKKGFIGVGGVFKFNKDGTNDRAISLVTPNNGKLLILDEAPKNF